MINKQSLKEVFLLTLKFLFYRKHKWIAQKSDVEQFLEKQAECVFENIWKIHMLNDRERANKLIEYRPMIGEGEK